MHRGAFAAPVSFAPLLFTPPNPAAIYCRQISTNLLSRQQGRQIVGGKNMRLRKKSLEHDIPQLMIGGIPVLAEKYAVEKCQIAR